MKELSSTKKIIIASTIIILVIASIIIYLKYNEQKSNALTNPTDENQQLIQKVGVAVELPNETPSIATVTDKEKLKQYPFFSKAEIGDKVLIYNAAKKAFLFRPTNGKLIEVGPIVIANNEATASGTQTTEATTSTEMTSPPKVALFNGTKGKGVAAKGEIDLKAVLPTSNVITKSNSKNDYPKTVIVLLNPSLKLQAELLAQSFNATLQESLPEKESPSKADIVVYLGEDRI